MAETVKKSRIVSETDDNLEEALMEEFNMRLKKCMSQDDLQQPNQETAKTISESFILAEQENYYEEPVQIKQNGHHHHKEEEEEVEEENSIYENIGHQNHKTEVKTDQYIDMESTSAPPKEDDESGVYEDIDDDDVRTKLTLTLTDMSEVRETETIDAKSAKDRMLLSTETSCLLFTQTVTSPMLTPSEENIDFLKGFRRESNSNGDSEVVTDIDEVKKVEKEENVYENAEFLKRQSEEGVIYENLKEVQENIYENLKDLEVKSENVSEDVIYQNIEELKEEVEEDKSEEIVENIEEVVDNTEDDVSEETKTVDVLKQINKFEIDESTQVTQSYVETTTIESSSSDKALKKKKSKKSRKEEKENISVKSSFSKFDALQKKNVLHVRSSDSSKAQEKFNGAQVDTSNCRSCGKAVFQMEQIKAEKAVWHKNCFRCTECNKQLNVDTYQSNEGTLYCKPHFKALFAPKAVEDDTPRKPRKPELIIRESQPVELPPDVVRASDKPDLGLEELQSLNVKERFQVFEQHQSETSEDRTLGAVNVKRSPSILSKLAKFQAKGMDIGVADDSLNGIPIEESSSEEEEEEDGLDGEDADLIRAKRVQKEKPFHFTGMSDVKSKWEHGEQLTARDERREERKQEIQSIRNKLFMGKQRNMKEAYQQAVMESESCTNLRKEPIEVCDTKSLKERFEKGELVKEVVKERDGEESEVFESEISKKSRSLFLELDANASKAPQMSPLAVTPKVDIKKARDNYILKTSTEETVKSSSTNIVDDVQIRTADIQQRFKFFETYKEPEKAKKTFRITPPREGQVKAPTPDRETYKDPEIVRAEEVVDDSVIAKETHTASKMLNKFRQMEENLAKEPQPTGPKPLKRFTPPPEPTRTESSSEGESGSEEDEEEEDEVDQGHIADADLLEAQKAARAKQLRAKFERWEANEIKREQNNSTVNIIEELGDESQIESTKSLRARFESMRESSTETNRQPRVKVNRFV